MKVNLERVTVEGISKKYNLGTIGGFSKDTSKDENSILWALQDISFKVSEGEVFGIIGKNGAGKSTLLKILARIVSPTTGSATLRGKLSALLEVGTGFHPELTGLENIYLNGAILGMSRREITKKLEQIIDFSGVEKFIHTPIKRYSSGMKVRLGFAVAAHLDPDILIIDEVLAVGDFEFQQKCIEKMKAASQDGRTILFVSHSMESVLSLTQNCILLDQGGIKDFGSSKYVVSKYLNEFTGKIFVNKELDETKEIECTKAEILSEGENLLIKIEYLVRRDIDCSLSLEVVNSNASKVFTIRDTDEDFRNNSKKLGKYSTTIEARVDDLLPGLYYVTVSLTELDKKRYHYLPRILSFSVEGNKSNSIDNFDRAGVIFKKSFCETKKLT